jgi:hypothetical protein
MGPWFTNSQRWIHLVGLLKYNLFFSALLIFLPLTAVEGVWLNTITGNLFVDLTAKGIFWATTLLFSTFWSLMLIIALAVDDHEGVWLGPFWRRRHNLRRPAGYIPPWAEAFFGFPTTRPQFVFFTTLALPGIVVTVWYSRAPGWSSGAALLGGGVMYLIFMTICLLTQLADNRHDLIPRNRLVNAVWNFLSSIEWLQRLVQWLWEAVSLLFSFSPFKYLLVEDAASGPRILIGHFLATFTITVLTSILVVVAWCYPGHGEFLGGRVQLELSPVAYVYILLLWLIWLFGGLEFHIPRWLGLSPLVFLLLLILLGYKLSQTDHYYQVLENTPQEQTTEQNSLSPTQAATTGRSENLVIITSAGGGILAAGWTTLALKMLICQRPALLKELRLFSTVSGGSVGAAYYLDALNHKNTGDPPASWPPPECTKELDQWLEDIHQKSIESSLGATAYGFAFQDFWRVVTGGGSLWHEDLKKWKDRGLLLEEDWARIAAGHWENGTLHKAKPQKGQAYPIGSLKSKIREGALPDFIFNATDMESGLRVMITPTTFQTTTGRAGTLTELLSSQDATAGERISLWTAARLSATFSWVSPAARADLPQPASSSDHRPEHHLIDGGYHDNFGVASALEWLHSTLQQDNLPFRRIAIVQLRAFRPKEPQEEPPQGGAISAFLGPLLGLANIRDAAAFSRNEFELERFVTLWNEQLKNAGKLTSLKTFVFEPSEEADSGPLSWQLSESQKDRLLCSWYDEKKARQAASTNESCKEAIATLKATGKQDVNFWAENIQKNWHEMNAFLTQ